MTRPQQHSTTTPTTTPDATPPEWEVWVDILSPHRMALLAARLPQDPTREDPAWPPGSREALRPIDARHDAVDRAMARVPEGLELGRDRHGRPIIAFEARFEVRVVAPDGSERVVEGVDRLWPQVVGWKTRGEFEDREARGEGIVAEHRDPATRLRIWTWREGPVAVRF
jgi:hypothetical protein